MPLITLYLQCQASSAASSLCLLGFYFPVAMLCSPCCRMMLWSKHFHHRHLCHHLKRVICCFVDLSLQVVGVDKEIVGRCAVFFFLFLFCFFCDVTGSAAVVGGGRSILSSSWWSLSSWSEDWWEELLFACGCCFLVWCCSRISCARTKLFSESCQGKKMTIVALLVMKSRSLMYLDLGRWWTL